MRLTKKTKGSIYMYNFDTNCDDETREQRSIETHNKIVDKLGKLEDVEEEMGFELLVILNKVLKQGAWFMLPDWNGSRDRPSFVRHPTLGYSNQWYLEYDYFIFHLADYGKTWALTMKELL